VLFEVGDVGGAVIPVVESTIMVLFVKGWGDLPVDADEVDVAASTCVHEVTQPIESHTAAAVGHGRRTKVHFFLESFGGFHVLFPGRDGRADGHTGTTCAVSTAESAN
jgi:hypothetical protein